MLSRVSTTRRAALFLHLQPPLSFTQRSYPLSALASSNEITHTAGTAPYLCRHLNTGGHLLNAPCDDGGHAPLCKTEGAHHAVCKDAPLQASPVKTEPPNACIQSYVKKLSASTVRRRKGHSSHGDGKASGIIDANGYSAGEDVKASESGATVSKVSRKKRQARNREVKVVKSSVKLPCSKASRKSTFLGYGEPSHVSDASSGLLYPSLPLQTLLIHSLPKEGKMESQIKMLELQKKVELLEAENMSANDAERLFKTRAFRSASFEHLSAVLQVLKEAFGTGESARQALANSSKFLVHPAELLQQTLKVFDDFQIKKEITSVLFSRYPTGRKVQLLRKRLSFLKELGLTVEALNRICHMHPLLLSASVEKSILPKLEFLMRTGFTEKRLLQLLWRWPRILAYSLDDNLIMKYEYFRQLGFSGKKLCGAIERLVSLSIENLQVHVQSIKDLGFSDEDVQRMITRQPNLLALSTECFKAKLDYLVHEQDRDMAEIVKCPTCLMYSLHDRTVPRFKCIEKLGLCKVYSLSTILCTSNARFKNKFGVV